MLDAEMWSDYFDSIALDGEQLASVYLLPRRGNGTRKGPLTARTLRAIRYDHDRDVLQVGVGGTAQQPALRYFISRPRRIAVEQSRDARTIVVDDSDSVRTAISVRGRARVARPHTPALLIRS